MRSGGVGARWVRPANIHLTLKFLGDTDSTQAGAISAAMQAAVSGQPPLKLATGGLGGFPNLTRPRVLWLAMAADIERLLTIQGLLEDRLVQSGFPRDHRPFRGHLTIGRIRDHQRWTTRATVFVRSMQALTAQPFTVDALIWYQSRLHPGGVEYTELARVLLNDG